jgi:hypothetical protein
MTDYSRYPQSREVYDYWLKTLYEEAEDKLSSWERDFLESVAGQLAFRGNLTEKQAQTLERIYAEKTT